MIFVSCFSHPVSNLGEKKGLLYSLPFSIVIALENNTIKKRYKIYVYLSLKTQIMDINNQLAYIYYLAYHIVHIVSW